MGNKYLILASKYPFMGHPNKCYQTKWFLVFAVRFVYCLFKYEIIDVQVRDNKRMDRIDYNKSRRNEE